MTSITRSMVLGHVFKSAARPSAFARPASRLAQSSLKSASLPFQSARVAAFHVSARKNLFPAPPQRVVGTVNDPTPIKESHPVHGSYHWTFERALSVGLIPLTVAPFIGGSLNPILDSIFCATLLLHSHIGFDACITDYFPGYRMPGLRNLMTWLLRTATVLTGIGLYEFETNDVGITAAIAKIWKA
ncbi:putative succinate dehydrogenase subunit CybS [Microthyrium microscopicum]|uniref:Succinate dehydrogenase [ubiquinone] cytochrome b small subunit n=1 Tax=Microthyrium microscopicum TaxID=703497 RepID=A0A6A6U7D1_9PEZI|nr:putative succinate dehydrogenase subunit CybS [Microthyrium microscopicum]